MSVTFLGVRHHSPACAGLVRDTIRTLQPAYVLIEGPADFTDRLGELTLGHELPIAIFTSYRDAQRHHASWSPFCAHSPEWVALTEGRLAGADVRFIDLPAWHEGFAQRANRYADAERRYTEAVDALCVAFAVDNTDALWDHLFEIQGDPALGEHLAAYFDLVRGDASPDDADAAREAYMAAWIAAAAAAAGDAPVVVVTGGFHRPALVRAHAAHPPPGTAEVTQRDTEDGTDRVVVPPPPGPAEVTWPEVPVMPEGAVGGSYLVPFSFKRLDAFDGYQSGMPSPAYYQRVWDDGVEAAGEGIVRAVTERLRRRRQPVSTADLIAARTLSLGLGQLRGHRTPGRVDILEGLVSALVNEALETPTPWSRRGQLAPGTEPVIVEMVAALSGDVVGRLHPDTPHPPLVHDVAAELERHGLPDSGRVDLDLTDPQRLAAARVLHRLRVLGVEGVVRLAGPTAGGPPVLAEVWELAPPSVRLPSLLEAGSYGATLLDAAAAALGDRLGPDAGAIAAVLFDAALCGLTGFAGDLLARLAGLVATVADVGGLADLLLTTLGLWRHDRLLGSAGSAGLAGVVAAAVARALWLVEGIRASGPAPADDDRLRALVGVRDAVVHAEAVLTVDRAAVLGVAARCTGPDRPPDLRGAAVGLLWALDEEAAGRDDEVARAVRLAGRPELLGDFLAGLFALAREQVLAAAPPGVLGLLDEIVGGFSEREFLTGLPALRLSFSWFPPREREAIAHAVLALRGAQGAMTPASLLRLDADAGLLAHARAVEARVADLLVREALLARGGAPDA